MFILRLVVIFLLSINLSAFNDGPISQKTMKKAERKYGGKVINRFLKYNKLLIKIKPLDERNKLKIVNKFFNQVPYVRDIENWKQEDYWATPLEFLSRAKGDSEDYVIAKYFALKTSGVDVKKLYFTYVTSKKRREPHMVLSYFETPSSDPFILDNFNHEILSAKDRDDLSPVYNFNPSASTPQANSKQHSTHKKWEKLYKRVQRNKL